MSSLPVRVLRSAPFAVAVVVALAWAGLAAPTNLTLPWSELGRPRPAAWETYTWAAALIGLAALLQGPRSPAVVLPRRVLHGAVALAAAGALAWVLNTPTKWTLNVTAAPTQGAVTAPMLAGTRVMWTRRLAEGPALRLSGALLANEAALAGLAGGIHESAAVEAVAQGQRSGVVVSGQALVRRGLWALQAGATALTTYGRLSLLLTLPLAALSMLRGGVPGPLVWAIRLPLWAIPVANTLSVLLSTVFVLPDDLGLRGKAALVALAQLGAVALADWAGRPVRV